MADYGLNESGFVVKDYNTIYQEIKEELEDRLGSTILLVPEDPLNEIVEAFAEREYSIWQMNADLYASQYISKASGVSLDYACEMVNIIRDPAVKSNITKQAFWGTATTVIPAGTVVSLESDATQEWQTLVDITIGAGIDSIIELTYSAAPDAGTFKLSAYGQVTDLLPYNATATEIEDALNSFIGIQSCIVTAPGATGDYTITFEKQEIELIVVDNTVTESSNPVTITLSTTQAGENQAEGFVEATIAQEQSANIYTVNVINTPVTGLDDSINLIASTSGANIESDDDLRARALTSYQIVKYSTFEGIKSGLEDLTLIESVRIVENDTSTPLFPSTPEEIPAHAFKTWLFPIQTLTPEEEQEVAEDLWSRKPAGIQSVGDLTFTVKDSQGFDHTVGFSYANDVDIYLELDLVTNSNFPINGEDTLSEQIVDWGNTLGPGVDVIVNGSNSVCGQISLFPGIDSYTLRIGKTVSPTGSSNIVIDDGTVSGNVEVSKWDVARVTITIP